MINVATVGIALGVVVVAAGLIWRRVGRLGARREMQAALESTDADTRISALNVLGGQGIGSYAEFLLVRSAVEHDPRVRRAIATVVARNQWEPVQSPAMAELRLWAHQQFAMDAPAEASTSLGAPEAAPAADPAGTPPAPSPAPAQPRAPQVAAQVHAPAAVTHPGPPSPSAPLPLVVVGVGGPAGVAMVEALRPTGRRIIAVDPDPLADGLLAADESLVTPAAQHPSFVGVLCQLVERVGAGGIACADAEMLRILAVTGNRLAPLGVATWFPDPHAAAVSRDRATVSRFLAAVGVPSDFGDAAAAPTSPDAVGEETVGSTDSITGTHRGRAFAVDALVNRAGVLVAAVSHWRPVTRRGETVVGSTFHERALPGLVSAALSAVGLKGPATVYGVLRDDGAVVLTGIDPGFSAGLPLALAAGADLVGQYISGLFDQPVRGDLLTYHDGVSLMRTMEGTAPDVVREERPEAGAGS